MANNKTNKNTWNLSSVKIFSIVISVEKLVSKFLSKNLQDLGIPLKVITSYIKRATMLNCGVAELRNKIKLLCCINRFTSLCKNLFNFHSCWDSRDNTVAAVFDCVIELWDL